MPTATEHPAARGHTVAESMVLALARLGVDVIFLNPGTDTAPVQEAIARLNTAGQGIPVPRVVLCAHESVALAAASAYYAVTRRPQVVMVHVDVGTQNLGAMMHNAFRSEAAVLIIAGRTPVTAYGELPGGRDHVVHWQQDVPDQAGVVRPYTRWCGEVHAAQALERQLARALQVAASSPSGPAYLTVPRETLMAPARAERQQLGPARSMVPTRMFPDPRAVEEVANRLTSSRRPLIVTSRIGRNPAAVPHLVDLADLTGAHVIDRRERMNFPSGHPALLLTDTASREALRTADLVLVVDDPVPWVPMNAAPAPDAFVALVDVDPTHSSMPGWCFDIDLSIQADATAFLQALCARVRENTGDEASTHESRDTWSGFIGDPAEPDGEEPSRSTDAAMSPSVVARALDAVLSPDDILITEATTNAAALRQFVTRTLPGTVFHPGGSGLGWAMGAAVGSRLAAPNRRVVVVLGDGSFLFANPVAALWTAHAAHAPFLAVVLQNGGYAASRKPVFDLFPGGVSSHTADVVGTRLENPPDYALLSEACGGYGGCARTPKELDSALGAGAAAVAQGRCAVIGVPVSSPWFAPTLEPTR